MDTSCGHKVADTCGQSCGARGQSCGHMRTKLWMHADKVADTCEQSCGRTRTKLRTKLRTHADKVVDTCGQSCAHVRSMSRIPWFRTVPNIRDFGISLYFCNFGLCFHAKNMSITKNTAKCPQLCPKCPQHRPQVSAVRPQPLACCPHFARLRTTLSANVHKVFAVKLRFLRMLSALRSPPPHNFVRKCPHHRPQVSAGPRLFSQDVSA